MTNSREQQGFRPRIYLFKRFESGKWEFTQDSADERDIEYLSLSEHTALLSEAVREAREKLRDEISEKVDQKLQSIMAGNLSVLVDSYRRQINSVIEAASTEGGKGGE